MRWIRYSHADAAESVYGAGGGGVRRRGGRGGLKLRDKKGLSDAAGLKGQGLGGGCSDLSFGTGGWGGEGLLESLSQVPLWLLRDVEAWVSGSNADKPLGWR